MAAFSASMFVCSEMRAITLTMLVISMLRSPRFLILLAPACTLVRSESMPRTTFCTASEPSSAESWVRLAAVAATSAFWLTRPMLSAMRCTAPCAPAISCVWVWASCAMPADEASIWATASDARSNSCWTSPSRPRQVSTIWLKASATLPRAPSVTCARTVRSPSAASDTTRSRPRMLSCSERFSFSTRACSERDSTRARLMSL